MPGVRDFVLVTHTRWSETPRIRHQIARLIATAGHRVLFVERAEGPLRRLDPGAREVEPRIFLTRTKRLMHHQLRLVAPLDWANAAVVRRGLTSQVRASGFAPDSTIINFTHDYDFLRPDFPDSEIITVIHDDFEAQARIPGFGHVTRMLASTCRSSHRVLALSNVLCQRLRTWSPAELFYPWSTLPYRAPHGEVGAKDTLLFWGFFGSGLDTEAVRRIAERLQTTHPDMRIMLVGPTQAPCNRERIVAPVQGLRNVIIQDATPLDKLPLDRVLAALIPYRRKGDMDAVELPNKALQLLAHGLPIVKTGMPNAVPAPFIMSIDDEQALDAAMARCRSEFLAWQPQIRDFLAEHSAAARLKALGIEPANG